MTGSSSTATLPSTRPFPVGSPGGSRIIGAVFNALLFKLLHGMELQAAVNRPRVIARNGPAELEMPLYRNKRFLLELTNEGYQPRDGNVIGSVQAIEILEDGWLFGAGDPRREGLALGY